MPEHDEINLDSPKPESNQKGMSLVITLLLMALITSLGMAAIMMSNMDTALSGNQYAQKSGEAAADAGMNMAMAMIFAHSTSMHLPITVTPSWTGSRTRNYKDKDMDISFYVKYKVADNVNYKDGAAAGDVVHYGQDYKYDNAPKVTGRQPVFTVYVTDNKTGYKTESDVISSLGFTVAGALFVKGNVSVHKDGLATDETISFYSGESDKPALVTTQSSANVRIQSAQSKAISEVDNCGSGPTRLISGVATAVTGSNMSYKDDLNATCNYYSPRIKGSDNNTYICIKGHTAAAANKPVTGASWATYWEKCTTAPAATVAWATGKVYTSGYIKPDVYTVAEISAETDQIKKEAMQHILFKCVDNFNQASASVIQYSYAIGGTNSMEEMMGATFADLRTLADTEVLSSSYITAAVPNDTGGTVNTAGVFNASGQTYGSADNPVVVFVNSNMNDAGAVSGNQVVLMTNAGTKMTGYGILIINGDAKICGSINWTGLMIVRGTLSFRPWQGGNWCQQSGPDLKSTWNGFIMIGGNLDMQTLAGGTLELGFGDALGSSTASIKGIVDNAMPHKVLNWRRMYK